MWRSSLSTVLLLAAVALASTQAQTTGGAAADVVVARERALLDAMQKKDRKAFDALLADGAFLLNHNGRAQVASVVGAVFGPDYKISSVTMEDSQVKMIGEDAAILTYKSIAAESFGGESRTVTSYLSSVWVRSNGEWKLLFHQTSRVQP